MLFCFVLQVLFPALQLNHFYLLIDSRDWRAHLEQMKQHRTVLQETLSSTTSQLEKLASDLGSTLGKIQSREKFLNSQLEPQLYQYRTVQVRVYEQHSIIVQLITLAQLQELVAWSLVDACAFSLLQYFVRIYLPVYVVVKIFLLIDFNTV